MDLSPVSEDVAVSVSWRSYSKGDVKNGTFTSKGSRTVGNAPRHRGGVITPAHW